MSLKPPTTQHADEDHDHDLEPDLDLTIRFSASLPDLLLTIPGSLHANTATLKQLIRSRLPAEYADRRIRLIYAGKALVDDVPLTTSLGRNVSRPPSRISTPGPYGDSNVVGGPKTKTEKGRDNGVVDAKGKGKAKGKLAVRDSPSQSQYQSQSRIYIHCSIGDIVLSPTELAAEAACAETGAERDKNGIPRDHAPTTTTGGGGAPQPTTIPAPRGFDRLLNAGFTPAEVQSLRLQFLAIQAHTHTPDTMPSPNTLRDMEDRWLDSSDPAGGADPGTALGGGGGPGAGAVAAEDDMQAGALDDMIWGTAMGFFWPIGCLMWGVREEGIWSQRRKMAVVVGFMLNVGLGIIRYTG